MVYASCGRASIQAYSLSSLHTAKMHQDGSEGVYRQTSQGVRGTLHTYYTAGRYRRAHGGAVKAPLHFGLLTATSFFSTTNVQHSPEDVDHTPSWVLELTQKHYPHLPTMPSATAPVACKAQWLPTLPQLPPAELTRSSLRRSLRLRGLSSHLCAGGRVRRRRASVFTIVATSVTPISTQSQQSRLFRRRTDVKPVPTRTSVPPGVTDV